VKKVARSGALQVGYDATCDTHDVRWRCTEVVVPRSCSSPHLVVLQQIRINEHAQLSAVTEGRDAAIGLLNPSRTASN
jgi:predicted RNA-binding protein with PUA-like domain